MASRSEVAVAPLHSLLHIRVHKILCIVTSVMMPQRDLSHVCLGTSKILFLLNVRVPKYKHSPGCFLPNPHEGLRLARRRNLGTLPGHPCGCKNPLCACRVTVRASVETSSPKWGQSPARIPKRCHARGLKATFLDPSASLWDAVAKICVFCANPLIYYVLSSFCWRVPFTLNVDSGTQCALDVFF